MKEVRENPAGSLKKQIALYKKLIGILEKERCAEEMGDLKKVFMLHGEKKDIIKTINSHTSMVYNATTKADSLVAEKANSAKQFVEELKQLIENALSLQDGNRKVLLKNSRQIQAKLLNMKESAHAISGYAAAKMKHPHFVDIRR